MQLSIQQVLSGLFMGSLSNPVSSVQKLDSSSKNQKNQN
jgi:hypothetical protein